MTREPELTFSGQGMEICKVGLACSEKYGEKETPLFIDGTAFKKTATMLNTVQKGHRIMVLGKISTESWQDKDNGAKRSKTVMIIESFEFIEPKQPGTGQQPQNNSGFQGQQYQQGFQPPSDFKQGPPEDDSLPF
jgi:single-strand DNA-binding protein